MIDRKERAERAREGETEGGRKKVRRRRRRLLSFRFKSFEEFSRVGMTAFDDNCVGGGGTR